MHRETGFLKSAVRYLLLLCYSTGLLVLVFSLPNAFGRDVSFTWIANADDPPVDGYRLYYKIGDPGATLNDYSGTDAVGGNPSPVEIPGQYTTSYTLRNLLDLQEYSFVLTAYRDSEESGPTNAIIMGENATSSSGALSANLSVDVLNGEAPLIVTFDATLSTGDITQYKWTFGDGTAGSGSIISHTFDSAGTFTVTLTVSDTSGATNETTFSISVTEDSEVNNPPTAVVSLSSSVGYIPLPVEFDGSSSTDKDGDVLSYGWDFGDGGRAGGALASHTYLASGLFNAKLTVADAGGLTDSITAPVIVSEPSGTGNTPPTAVIVASASKGIAPLTVSFDGGRSFDQDGNIINYTWNFGDGTISDGKNVTHKFLQPANFQVTLKVKDDKGASSLPATLTIMVLDKDQGDSLSGNAAQSLPAIMLLLLNGLSPEIIMQNE